MNATQCPFHPDYDGIGEPPDPNCPNCDELLREHGA